MDSKFKLKKCIKIPKKMQEVFPNTKKIPVIYVEVSATITIAAVKGKYVDEVIKMYIIVVKLCKTKHRLWSFNYS